MRANPLKRANPLRIDPTRTVMLRKRFSAEVMRRFAKFKRDLQSLIVTEDAFGLKFRQAILNSETVPSTETAITDNSRWAYLTTPDQLEHFRQWLENQISLDILQSTGMQAVSATWLDKYIREAYLKGQARAFDDVVKPALWTGISPQTSAMQSYQGIKLQFLASPVSLDRLQLLMARSHSELKGATDAMSQQLSRELLDSMVRDLNPREIAKNVLDRVTKVGQSRALALVQTEIVRAHSEGVLDAMEALGVDQVGVMVEWSTGSNPCNVCSKLKGVVLTVAKARGLFPRHPNAVFAGSTFVPYGECLDLVRAWYRGPCVVLHTSGRGENRTTIGPNHPMMTRRGMVPAAQLREGDEVLYDTRVDDLIAGVLQVNDKQVPLVENAFESCIFVNKCASITSSSSNLHGDRVFCQGEVQAVNPTRGLLLVLDSCGIEQLREDNFVGADISLAFVPGDSSSDFSLSRLDVPTTRFMGSGNLVTPLQAGHLTPLNSRSTTPIPDVYPHPIQFSRNSTPAYSESFGQGIEGLSRGVEVAEHFAWKRIHRVSFGEYEGLAFDATTASSLYCSGGFVVSNCRCSPIPANIARDNREQIRGKRKVMAAMHRSIRAEYPKRSLQKAKAKSKWAKSI